MCGRATVINPDGITEKVYGYTKKFVPSDWKPRYNLNPREEIPSVYFDPFLRERVLRTMHWNLIPPKLASREKVDAFDSQYSTFNARIETVSTAPTFQDAWRSRRCLVVVDGIIEWVGDKGRKTPHLIRHRDGRPIAMAGLWSHWRGRKDDEGVWSSTVIVKDADEWYSRFHDRMAVPLAPENYDAWLDPQRKTGQLDLLKTSAYHEDELEYFPISRLVNIPGYDAPDILDASAGPPPPPGKKTKESIELLLDL